MTNFLSRGRQTQERERAERRSDALYWARFWFRTYARERRACAGKDSWGYAYGEGSRSGIAYGAISMARQLQAITVVDYDRLNARLNRINAARITRGRPQQ